MPNLRLAITITQPSPKHAWMGLTGRISSSMLPMIAPDFLDRAVYVCGSERFMQTMRSLLESMKFPMQNYQEESFGGTSLKSAQAPSESRHSIQPISSEPLVSSNGQRSHSGRLPSPSSLQETASVIHFTKSDRQVLVDGSAAILEVAEEAGIQMRHACRVGACGACKVEVRRGEVRYQTPPTALTSADQQAGYALSCVAYPVGSLEIDA
jgi:ferredoxin